MKRPHSAGDRRANTPGRALDIIRSRGPVSRVELAEAVGMAQASMTPVVRYLLDEQLVREAGHGESSGGRPRILLEINPRARYSVGVQLGWQESWVAVTDLVGALLAQGELGGARHRAPEDIVAEAADEVRRLLRVLAIPDDLVLGLGLVAPGPIDAGRGTAVQLPSSSPWRDFSVTEALSAATGFRVIMDNDATAAAVGEYWSATAATHATFATIFMDVGIGAGIMVDGRPYRGVSGNAGEIGHVTVDMSGERCHCGNRGCLELYAAPAATERRYSRAVGRQLPYRSIVQAASEGDAAAAAAIDSAASTLGIALVSLANALDLDLFILAGPGFAGAAERYSEAIQRHVDRAFFVRRAHPVRVRTSSNTDCSAAALGAASLPLHDLVSP